MSDKILSKGPFKGMTLEMASETRLTAHGDLIPEFMHVILGIDAFLITDESSLDDFISMVADTKTAEMAEIWAKIASVYGITYDEVGSDYIVDILDSITPPPGGLH